MAAARRPTLRLKKATGVYFARWGGKDHYFTKDQTTSRSLFESPTSTHPGSLRAWESWSAARAGATPGSMPLVDVSYAMLGEYEQAGRREASRSFRKHLRRFMSQWGAWTIGILVPDRPSDRGPDPIVVAVNALIDDMRRAGFSEHTIKNDVVSIKRLINWSSANGYCREISWRAVRRLRLSPSLPAGITHEQMRSLMSRLHSGGHTDAACWCALQYLTVARPSTVVELVHGRGEFRDIHDGSGAVIAERAIFSPHHAKSTWRSRRTYVVLSASARSWLSCVRPRWNRLDTYSAGFRRAARGMPVGFGPKEVQKAGCSHLRYAGVSLSEVDALQGHAAPGVSPSYQETPWHLLLERVSRISI